MRLSVRARILSAVLVLVAVALLGSVLVTRAILYASLDGRVDRELAQEVTKFRTFADDSNAGTVDALLAGYLREKVPDSDETFFSIVDGKASRRIAHTPPARLDRDHALVRQLADDRRPSYGWTDSAAGRVRYAVVPVHVEGDSARGALVAVEFYDLMARDYAATVRVLALVGFGTLVVAGVVGWLVAGRALRPVRELRRTAEAVSGTDLGRRIEVRGHDDLAQLAATFNHMLDRLEDGFATQRRFLDDAGHELRTPITVIRGHLELMGDDPAERAATLALVTDELDRMRRIVDDLLLLARSDQPTFVRPAPVELADLPLRVVAASRALGDRRWVVDEIGEGEVLADEQRLVQALLQLTTNAVAHTSPGDVVAVGSAVRDERVCLWVRDTGVGLPDPGPDAGPDAYDGLFRRFARGREDDRGHGAGLGLAIVKSIATAHGGTVTAGPTPGGGATFVLDLPLHRAGDAVLEEVPT